MEVKERGGKGRQRKKPQKEVKWRGRGKEGDWKGKGSEREEGKEGTPIISLTHRQLRFSRNCLLMFMNY